MNMKKIYLFTRFERFWHWCQAAIILMLLFTGFEIHGNVHFFGFQKAVQLHNLLGQTWAILFVFIIFWLLTTGEWRQYIPTSKKLFEVVLYYSFGIFKGLPHPVPKSKTAKHNPLQRLTYLGLTAILLNLQMATGLLYFLYNDWPIWGWTFLDLRLLALIHLTSAFAILTFVIVHVYMATTGHSVTSYFVAMITGWEEVDEGEVADWEIQSRP